MGGNVQRGEGSRNSTVMVGFCERQALVIPQTFGRQSEAKENGAWATWHHPATKVGQAKDFILYPVGQTQVLKKVRPCPSADLLGSDHTPVICRFLPRWHKKVVEARVEAGPRKEVRKRGGKQGEDGWKAKVRKVQVLKEDIECYQAALQQELEGQPKGWKVTRRAMTKAAVKSFRVPEVGTDRKRKERNAEEIGPLLKRHRKCQEMLSKETNPQKRGVLLAERKEVKLLIRQCNQTVEKAKEDSGKRGK
jgi:hypothetical protein